MFLSSSWGCLFLSNTRVWRLKSLWGIYPLSCDPRLSCLEALGVSDPRGQVLRGRVALWVRRPISHGKVLMASPAPGQLPCPALKPQTSLTAAEAFPVKYSKSLQITLLFEEHLHLETSKDKIVRQLNLGPKMLSCHLTHFTCSFFWIKFVHLERLHGINA